MFSPFPEQIYRTGVVRTTKNWRLRPEKYRLEGTKCNQCGKTHWPGKKVCPVCNSTDLSRYRFSRYGCLTAAQFGPAAWQPMQLQGLQVYGLDRVLSIVRLDEEQETFVAPTDLVDCDHGKIYNDMEVEMVLRKHRREPNGAWNYAYMWMPKD
jgi:uncharacterized OB-fold protein